MSRSTTSIGRPPPSSTLMPVADSSQLSTQFRALLAIVIASSAINNPSGGGHAIHDIPYHMITSIGDQPFMAF